MLSSDATLTALTGIILTPPFDPDTLTYTATTRSRQLVLRATRGHNRATLRWTYFSGRPIGGLQLLFDTRSGENIVVVDVTAQDKTTTRQYQFTITRT